MVDRRRRPGATGALDDLEPGERHAHEVRHLGQARPPAEVLAEQLDRVLLRLGQLVHGPRHPQRPPAVAEVAAQGADDGRRGVGEERRAPRRVEPPQCEHERLVGHLHQVLEGLAPPVVPLGGGRGERAVPLDEAVEVLGLVPIRVGDVHGPQAHVDQGAGGARSDPGTGGRHPGHTQHGTRPVPSGPQAVHGTRGPLTRGSARLDQRHRSLLPRRPGPTRPNRGSHRSHTG